MISALHFFLVTYLSHYFSLRGGASSYQHLPIEKIMGYYFKAKALFGAGVDDILSEMETFAKTR